jgi:hypothetical protein
MLHRCVVRLQPAKVLVRGVVLGSLGKGGVPLSQSALRSAVPPIPSLLLKSAISATLRGLSTAATPITTADGTSASSSGAMGVLSGVAANEDDEETVLIMIRGSRLKT